MYGYAHTAIISLPPCTTIVGSASGTHCFPADSVEVIYLPNSKINVLQFPDGSRYTQAKGIIYPVSYPTGGYVMIRRTQSSADSHPKGFLLSAGFALKQECKVAKLGKDISSYPPLGLHFSILSQDYKVRFFNGLSGFLFNPHALKTLPLCLLNVEQTVTKGITVHIKEMPYLVAIFCALLLVCPGLVQAYGSQDNKWGDIVNAVIGTGSVLVTMVLITLQKISGFDITSSEALRGFLIIRSNFGARLLARDAVKQIEEVACDPRIPAELIAHSQNSAVRTERTGWLKIGRSIKLNKMREHGYHVLKDKGLVLDLIYARFYSCGKNGTAVHIRRPGQEIIGTICDKFDGNEIFR